MGGFLSHLEPEQNHEVLNASCGPIRGNIYKHMCHDWMTFDEEKCLNLNVFAPRWKSDEFYVSDSVFNSGTLDSVRSYAKYGNKSSKFEIIIMIRSTKNEWFYQVKYRRTTGKAND
ncbi:hypothetical protein L3Y34_007526 [Caenorhabditis briggsae]|uniref:Uncharacterized protein n=1 Tax=Caenorhabditis briggsae TaxID=6238 RepID=A0AAE8ZZ06_CAEBR|nr:hypothetical protein L3Y34_007526 [Caenorhabditis briggsae]